MSNTEPPRFFRRFFQWYCKPPLQESILGDLEEQFYEVLEHKGSQAAYRKYIWNVVRFFRPGIVKEPEGTSKLNNYGMFKNYYKISIRSILRNKTFSALNVAGLSVGLASCLLILIYVQNELSFDTYHEKYDRTYRVLHYFGDKGEEVKTNNYPATELQVWGNAPIADALIDYFPQIESIFRFTMTFDWLVEYGDKRFQEKEFVFADSTMGEVFTWEWVAGSPATALNRPSTIVLTKQLAAKYFGSEDPLGKTLLMDSDPFEVTGVIDIPSNSHFSFDGFVSMATFIKNRPGIFDSWGYVDFYSYFTINENASIADLSSEIPAFLDKYYDSDYGYTFRFEALADAYLNSEAGRQPGPVGNRSNIILFISVAFFILVIAIINFTNLATARSVERAKEVAIRKTIGSQRGAIVFQFLMEAIILTAFAGLVAVGLVAFSHQYLEVLVDKPLPTAWLLAPAHLILGLLMLLVIGFMAGSYPALVLSRFKPIKVLRGAFKNSSEGIWLRKSLVVLQFALSMILLVGTTVVSHQLTYLRTHDKGFDADQVLVIDFGWDGRIQRQMDVIKSQLLKHPAVQSVAASRATPGDFFPNAGTTIESPTGEMITKGPALYEIDEDFVPTYQMNMVAGRNLSKEFPRDTTTALLVNEAAARLFGYANVADIVGKKFDQWGRQGKVIGVVKDFNYVSLHQSVEPLTMRHSIRYNNSMISLKLNSTDYKQTVAELQTIWEEVVQHRPFVAHFNDANFNEQYETDARFGTVFSLFTGLAIFVACLGLFGLTIYSTAQRAKEIGVRKVLGASTSRIVALLSYDFLRLFAVSVVLAVPVSYFAMKQWLQAFAYRIDIGWDVFAMAVAATLLLSLATMSIQTLRAASSNPVTVLKDE